MKRIKAIVNGDVQGVFFRHNAKKEADALGVLGWCRNEADGSVYVIGEGEDKSVDSFVKWLREGSPLSTVENVEVTEEKPTGTENGFEIR